MGSDMVVARGPATVNGHTVFGHNSHRPSGECQRLVRVAGREFASGEVVQTEQLALPQVRQTFTVLASHPEGTWGYPHGLNEHRFAAGCATWSSRLGSPTPGLLGTDLVRLVLERCRSARQAVDLLTDLVVRHGQGKPAPDARDVVSDSVFLLADPEEAFVIEAAGNAWVLQQIHESRAAGDVGVIRKDWDRISPGLADRVARLGWWECDGSKLDFVGSLSSDPTAAASALRGWGRATFLLEQQSGQIDPALLRRLLGDHFSGTSSPADPGTGASSPVSLCRHRETSTGVATAVSLVANLPADPGVVPIAWCAFGPPCCSVYFPISLEADLPPAHGQAGRDGSLWQASVRLGEFMNGDAERWSLVRDSAARLQARFDQEAEEFAAEAATLRRARKGEELRRLASSLMQNHVEQFQEAVHSVLAGGERAVSSAALSGS